MTRTVAARVRALASVVASEVERNPHFARALAEALGIRADEHEQLPKGRGGRRKKGAFDPVDVLRHEGESALQERLATLDVEALKDIVAENGMDQRRLALKWKNPERLVELIVAASQARMVRGDVFR